MIRKVIFLLLSLIFIIETKATDYKKGDLIFQVQGDGEFSKAISNSTSRGDSVSYVHVGIIDMEEDGGINVIEASPEEGVRIVSLEKFMETSPDEGHEVIYVIKRLGIEFPVEETIERAKSYLGEPYDWWYKPDNGKIYCSELVWESYRDFNGKRIFASYPMNFRDNEGNMPEFWVKLYEELGEEVPEGLPGTNPNDLSRDDRLIEISRLP